MKIRNLIVAASILWASSAWATCDITSSFTAGQVLTAAQLNTLVTDSEACSDNILNGDTWTGSIALHSGSDLNVYSDAGTNLVANIDGATGGIIGAPLKVGTYNINIKAATTTNANDSVTVECGNSACSAANPGFVVMNSGTVGDLVVFRVTADVTQLLTGAHWGIGTTGDITGALIRALFVNDNGTLRTCFAYLGGRNTVLTTDTNATQTSVNLPEEVLCNTAVGSATNTVLDFGFVRANFDDTGGAAEDLWALQTGVGDAVVGKIADGLWQPWNPVYTGFSSSPTTTLSRWTQVGTAVTVHLTANASGVSDQTYYRVTLPANQGKTSNSDFIVTDISNNSVALTTTGIAVQAAGSAYVNLTTTPGGAAWTAANNKRADFSGTYEVGPAASFIE